MTTPSPWSMKKPLPMHAPGESRCPSRGGCAGKSSVPASCGRFDRADAPDGDRPSPSPTDSTAAPPIWISPPGRVPSPTRHPREDCQTFHPPFRINAKSPAVSIQRRQGRGSTLFKRVKKRLARFVLTRRPCQSLSARLSLEAPGCTSPCFVPDALAAGGASSLPVFAKVLFRSLPFSPIICNRRGEVKLFRTAKRLKTDRRQFSCVSPFADA